MSISPNKYYRTGKIAALDPILEAMGYGWILRQIKDGRLPGKNTSGDPANPRFLVQGKTIIEFVKTLEAKNG